MTRPARVIVGVAAALSLAACGEEPEVTASEPELRAEACRVLGVAPVEQRSHAAVASGMAGTTNGMLSSVPAVGLKLPGDIAATGGILIRDSSIFVFDLALGQLVRLDPAGRVLARAGRTGRGPGEFNPSPGMLSGDFIGAHGDTVIAYDGRSVHRFTVGGKHVNSKPIPAIARPFLESPNRMRVDDGVAYIESMRSMDRQGGRMSALPNRYFHVWRMKEDSVETVAVLDLPQLPRLGAGGFFGSPAEARPSWDMRAGCLALMDGSTARLVLVDVRSGARDTVALALPERFVDVDAANATLPPEALPGPNVELPEPALLARFVDLRLSPDGWLWLRPVAPEGEIWRYHLTARQFSIDTVAGFPRGFTLSGAAFRTEMDDEGVTRILLLDRPLP